MNLFQEYQSLTAQAIHTPRALERMAEIMELACNDEELFESIMNLEYVLAQEEGLVTESNARKCEQRSSQLIQQIQAGLEDSPANYFSTTSK